MISMNCTFTTEDAKGEIFQVKAAPGVTHGGNEKEKKGDGFTISM